MRVCPVIFWCQFSLITGPDLGRIDSGQFFQESFFPHFFPAGMISVKKMMA
jgi:hypothetical protein